MKGSWIIGLVAGSMVGAFATAVALPYASPQLKRAIRRGRKSMNSTLYKMWH